MQESILEQQISDRFPCPQCGADLNFDPSAQALSCGYCGHREEIEAGTQAIKELDFASGEAQCSTDWGNATRVIQCDNCGAQVVLGLHEVATRCSFCGSSHVATVDALPGIRPGGTIPFAVAESRAREQFSRWLKSKFFAPGDLKSNHTPDRLVGTYIPCWTFDSATYSAYTAQRGDYYWTTRAVTVNRNGKVVTEHQQVREIRWRSVSGTHAQFFDDVLTHASARLDSLLARRAGRFDLSRLVDYRPEYLSGFRAEKYTLGLSQGWERAKDLIKDQLSSAIRRRIGGDEVRFLNFRTSYEDTTFKHVLLPLWLSAYQYQGRTYNFVVNGQTGEVFGEAPVSAPKVVGVMVLVLAVAAILAQLLR